MAWSVVPSCMESHCSVTFLLGALSCLKWNLKFVFRIKFIIMPNGMTIHTDNFTFNFKE